MNKHSSLEELSPKSTDNQRRFPVVAEVKQATPATVQKSLVPKDMYGHVVYFVSTLVYRTWTLLTTTSRVTRKGTWTSLLKPGTHDLPCFYFQRSSRRRRWWRSWTGRCDDRVPTSTTRRRHQEGDSPRWTPTMEEIRKEKYSKCKLLQVKKLISSILLLKLLPLSNMCHYLM